MTLGKMKTNRRHFIKSMSALGLASATYSLLSACAGKNGTAYLNEKITKIEIFRYDINIPRYFSWGTWHNRQHLFIKISSGDFYGWAETPASKNDPDFKPTAWVKYLQQFKGLTLGEAQKILTSEQVLGSKQSLKMLESLDMGLLDLSGRLQNKPAVELLGLTGRNTVPGLYCILDKDEIKVRAEAEKSIEQNLGHHMKFKMYGDEVVDMKLLRIIRDVLGDDAVVISDVNKGYKKWESLNELKSILDRFKANGLNAIEDPAHLKTKQWIELQKMVRDLTLIPDAPMRPAWKGLKTMEAGMGHIYNLHPSTMGSLTHTAQLAHKVKEIGAKVMIGDDSLVGPACSAWQQIAIGVDATWVEAIEKKADSKIYLECLQSSATKKEANGYYSFTPKPGFGLEIDTDRLKKVSELYIEI
ncbi:mandelate racemase/muconate lactonizing enzyme family protein [uncultured Maribacter sp.]|uniref:mandelate racemase/muconate lactonizing enzyme family protein n=1 Tax=uncultured Maribacter sp. TaxID=431308 RepID=UPI00261135EF|nr:mandelate racemase/muconate lactonizing enzyme family protein [uncultured Maribacter sp.]